MIERRREEAPTAMMDVFFSIECVLERTGRFIYRYVVFFKFYFWGFGLSGFYLHLV